MYWMKEEMSADIFLLVRCVLDSEENSIQKINVNMEKDLLTQLYCEFE